MRSSVRRSRTAWRHIRIGVALGAAGAICASTLTTATADEDTPSRVEVRAAKQDAAEAASDVGAIKARLAAAEQRVIDLGVEAGRMAERYNGARYKLQQARREARRTAGAADTAERRLEVTTGRLSEVLAASAAQNNSLRGLAALLEENGPTELLEQSSGFASLDDALSSDLQRYDARKQVFDLLSDRADRAVDRREKLADAAARAKAAAQAAVAAADAAAADIRSERAELIEKLARAQGLSESLVRERQRDIAEERRQEALDEAQEHSDQQSEDPDGGTTSPPDDTDEADPVDPPPDDTDEADPVDPPPDEPDENRPPPEDDGGTDSPPEQDNSPPDNGNGPPDNGNGPPDNGNGPPDNGNGPPEQHNGPPKSSGSVATAIRYARAQLGEPYVYGAAGPTSWDCSGLTMRAWGAAGVTLPHWSVAQYQATTPVSTSSIRRGDLLFWSNGSASSIYHVAMYLGNGMMIHAPRPGRSVEVVSIYYWILPDLAGRV